jgi:putative tryptophan/tyrosine transport system substrate-binding protein
MRRREFIRLAGGVAAALPFAASAQTTPIIGFLNSASVSGYAPMAAAFREGLKQTGFVPGENVQIE